MMTYSQRRAPQARGSKRLRQLVPYKSKEQRTLRCSFRHFTHEKAFCGALRTEGKHPKIKKYQP